MLINVPTPACHASTVAAVGEDRLLAWFGGTREGAGDVGIWLVRRTNGVWGKVRLIADEADMPHWNPVLYAEGDRVELFWKAGKTIPGWETRRMRSLDGGRTWEKAEGNDGPVRNKPVKLKSGRVIAPASVETEERWDAYTLASDDGGRTFGPRSFVPLKRDEEGAGYRIKGKGTIQPTLWQSVDGGVHMLLRSTEGVILRSDSFDEGDSWCPAYSTGMPNNNSGIDLVRTGDGRLWLLMNPVAGNWAARTPLTLLVSEDDGMSFRKVRDIETGEGEYSYPAIVVKGEKLIISYTWKREKIGFLEEKL